MTPENEIQPQKDSVEQFAKRLRSRFPDAYQDVDDAELTERFLKKNPVYTDKVSLPQGFSVRGAVTTGYSNLDSVYEQAAKTHNVPADLLIEQGRQETINFNPDVMYGRRDSPKGARGAGQFMPGSAPTYGLTVNANQDDRTDPVKSINAQAQYMRKLLDQFDGNEDLALAGYNSGEYRPSLKAGRIPNIAETQGYVKTIKDKLAEHRKQPLTLGQMMGTQTSPTFAGQTPNTLAQAPAVGNAAQPNDPSFQSEPDPAYMATFAQGQPQKGLPKMDASTILGGGAPQLPSQVAPALPKAVIKKVATGTQRPGVPQYDFERTGKVKVGDKELTYNKNDQHLSPDNTTEKLPQGNYRLRDDQGFGYVVNAESGDVQPESENVATVPITLYPASQRTGIKPPEVVKAEAANTIADTLLASGKLSVPKSDIAEWINSVGLRHLDTGTQFSDEDYYTQRGDAEKKDITFTNRDIAGLSDFSQKRRTDLEQKALDYIASGESNPEKEKFFQANDVDLNNLTQYGRDDVEMAKTKGAVAKQDFDRFVQELQSEKDTANVRAYTGKLRDYGLQPTDSVAATLAASKHAGWIDDKTYHKGLDEYSKLRTSIADQIRADKVADIQFQYPTKSEQDTKIARLQVSNDEIDKRMKDIQNYALSPGQKKESGQVSEFYNNLSRMPVIGDLLGLQNAGVVAPVMDAGGRGLQMIAGLIRPFSEDAAQSVSKQGQMQQLAAEQIGDPSEMAHGAKQALKFVSSTAAELPAVISASSTPLGAVGGFALTNAAESYGKGESMTKARQSGETGAVTGIIFDGAPVLSKLAGTKAFAALLTPETKAILESPAVMKAFQNAKAAGESPILNPEIRRALIASRAVEEGTRIGTIGIGTTGVELLSGKNLKDSLKTGLQNVLMDAIMTHAASSGEAAGVILDRVKGKIFKVETANGEKVVSVDKDGNIDTWNKMPEQFQDAVVYDKASVPQIGGDTKTAQDRAADFTPNVDQSGPPLTPANTGASEQVSPINDQKAAQPTSQSPPNVAGTLKNRKTGEIYTNPVEMENGKLQVTRENGSQIQVRKGDIETLGGTEMPIEAAITPNKTQEGAAIAPESQFQPSPAPLESGSAQPKVPERSVTLEAQRSATLDPDSPSIAVLYTAGEDVPQHLEPGIDSIPVGNDTLHVSIEKLQSQYGKGALEKLKAGEISVNDLIGGKAKEFADTSGGTSTVAVDENGNELVASKVSDDPPDQLTPADQKVIDQQRELHTERFPDAQHIEVPTEEVVFARAQDRPILSKFNKPKTVSAPTVAESTPVMQDTVSEAVPESAKEPPKISKRVGNVGRETIPSQTVVTERGTKANITPKVIDASELLTSLDEGYPAGLQPRDRSRKASKSQISSIANQLNPDLLGDAPKASDGRPLVVPVEVDGKTRYAVVSGNGRGEAIRAAYNADNEPSKAYREFAQSRDETSAKNPVYVGELNPDEIDINNFAREANESGIAKMSTSEQAKTDAEKLNPGVMSQFVPAEDGSIHTAANRKFIRDFFQTIPESERGEFQLPDGSLSQRGIDRVRNAILTKAYGEDIVQRVAESTDNNIKKITNALMQSAPGIADLNEGVRTGNRQPGLDISKSLVKATEKLAFLRNEGMTVDEYLKQGNLFEADLTPFENRILTEFDNYRNSTPAIRGILNNYVALSNEIGDPQQQSLFGEPVEHNAETVFRQAVKDYEKGYETPATTQTSLFDSDQGREVQPETSPASGKSVKQSKKSGTEEVKPLSRLSGDERLTALSKSTDLTETIPDITSAINERNSSAVDLSREGINIVREILGKGTSGGLTLSPAHIVTLINDIDAISARLKTQGYDKTDLQPLADLRENIEQAFENSDKGEVLVHVPEIEGALGHEETHQAGFKGISDKARREVINFRSGLDELSDTAQKAMARYAGENGLDIETSVGHAVAAEETFAHISDGNYEELGLTLDQATDVAIELMNSYAKARMAENPDLSFDEALKTYLDTNAGKYIEEAKNYANEKQQKSRESNVVEQDAQSPPGSSEASDRERSPEDGENAQYRPRRTIKTAEKRGIVEPGALPESVSHYDVKSVEGNIREAQDKIDRIGLDSAYNEAVLPIADTGEDSLRRHGTFQMETAQLLKEKSVQAEKDGDKNLAEVYNAQKKKVIQSIALQGTDAGQFIRQLGEWRVTDPGSVVEYVETKRSQNGLGKPLTSDEQKSLTDLATQLKDSEAKIAAMEARIAQLETSPKRKQTKSEKKMSDVLAKAAKEAMARLRNPVLQMVAKDALLKNVTDTPEFKKWFGAHGYADEQGNPIVVYHGTRKGEFDTFRRSKYGSVGQGIYFYNRPDLAEMHGDFVVPVYVRNAKIYAHEVVVQQSSDIKSAIGNRGTFDPSDPNILQMAVPDLSLKGQILDDLSDIGASILYTGFEGDDVMTPEQFHKEIIKELGKQYEDNWRQIHAESLAKFDKIQRDLRMQNAVERVRAEKGNELLSDAELIEKVNENLEKSKERTKIRNEHRKLANEVLNFPEKEAKRIADEKLANEKAQIKADAKLERDAARTQAQIDSINHREAERLERAEERRMSDIERSFARQEKMDAARMEKEINDAWREQERNLNAMARADKTRLEREFKANQKEAATVQRQFERDQMALVRMESAEEVKAKESFDRQHNQITKFVETAEKLGLNPSDEVLTGALMLDLKTVSPVELAKELQKRFPDLAPKTAESGKEKYEKQENLEKIAAQAVKLHKDVHAEYEKQRILNKGLTLEAKGELDKVKGERTKSYNQLLNTARTLERPVPNAAHVAADILRRAYVVGLQTATTNLISTGLERIYRERPMDMMDIMLQRGVRAVGKEIKNEGLGPDASLKIALWTPKADIPVLDDAGMEILKGLSKGEVMLKLINNHPEYFHQFYGNLSSDLQPAILKALDKAMYFMQKQELIMRNGEGVNALAQRAAMKGMSLSEALTNEAFTEDDLIFATKKALELTYATRPLPTIMKKVAAGEGNVTDMAFANVASLLRSSGAMDLIGATSTPFTGFMYNTINKMKVTMPVVAQARLAGKTYLTAKALKAAGEDNFWQQAIKEKWTSRQIVNQVWGYMAFGLLLAAVRSLGDRDEWYWLRVPMTVGMMEKRPENPTGSMYLDMRSQPAIAPLLFVANKFNRLTHGKDAFTNGDWDSANGMRNMAAEMAEGFTGFSYRQAVDNNDLYNAIWRGITRPGASLSYTFGQGDDVDRNGEKFAIDAQQYLGKTMGTLTNFLQFKTMKNIAQQLDDYEQSSLDLTDHPFWQGIDQRLPESRRLLKDLLGAEVKKDYATGEERKSGAFPILRILGFNLRDGNTIRPESSQAEILASKFAYGNDSYTPPVLPEDVRKAAIKRDFEKESDRIRAAKLDPAEEKSQLDKLATKLKGYDELTGGQEKYAEKALKTSDLQEHFKSLSVKDGKAQKVWAAATDAEKDDLRSIYGKKLEAALKDDLPKKQQAEIQGELDSVGDFEAQKSVLQQFYSNKMDKPQARKTLKDQLRAGAITQRQFDSQEAALDEPEAVYKAKNLDAASDKDFEKIEQFLQKLSGKDLKNALEVMGDKADAKEDDGSRKSQIEAKQLRGIIKKYRQP